MTRCFWREPFLPLFLPFLLIFSWDLLNVG